MFKIGEFSSLSKTTIKTLRYYEKENLLIPAYIDQINGYRYYETSQLSQLSKIISLREVGLSIKDIKRVLNGCDLRFILNSRKKEIEENIILNNDMLSKIKFLMEEINMKSDVVIKTLPECVVYYKEGIIKDFSEITEFILSSAEECLKLNPNIKCLEEDYCYINYLDGEYKKNDFKIRYAQAVKEAGIENENIRFMRVNSVDAVCIAHKGTYNTMRDSYNKIMKYIEDNGYGILEFPRECYIDGCWNKDNESDYLTEIQVPIKNSKN